MPPRKRGNNWTPKRKKVEKVVKTAGSYKMKRILDERTTSSKTTILTEYLIEWACVDPSTGQIYPPDWQPAKCAPAWAVEDWIEVKTKRAEASEADAGSVNVESATPTETNTTPAAAINVVRQTGSQTRGPVVLVAKAQVKSATVPAKAKTATVANTKTGKEVPARPKRGSSTTSQVKNAGVTKAKNKRIPRDAQKPLKEAPSFYHPKPTEASDREKERWYRKKAEEEKRLRAEARAALLAKPTKSSTANGASAPKPKKRVRFSLPLEVPASEAHKGTPPKSYAAPTFSSTAKAVTSPAAKPAKRVGGPAISEAAQGPKPKNLASEPAQAIEETVAGATTLEKVPGFQAPNEVNGSANKSVALGQSSPADISDVKGKRKMTNEEAEAALEAELRATKAAAVDEDAMDVDDDEDASDDGKSFSIPSSDSEDDENVQRAIAESLKQQSHDPDHAGDEETFNAADEGQPDDSDEEDDPEFQKQLQLAMEASLYNHAAAGPSNSRPSHEQNRTTEEMNSGMPLYDATEAGPSDEEMPDEEVEFHRKMFVQAHPEFADEPMVKIDAEDLYRDEQEQDKSGNTDEPVDDGNGAVPLMSGALHSDDEALHTDDDGTILPPENLRPVTPPAHSLPLVEATLLSLSPGRGNALLTINGELYAATRLDWKSTDLDPEGHVEGASDTVTDSTAAATRERADNKTRLGGSNARLELETGVVSRSSDSASELLSPFVSNAASGASSPKRQLEEDDDTEQGDAKRAKM